MGCMISAGCMVVLVVLYINGEHTNVVDSMCGVTFIMGILVMGGRGILAGLARMHVHAEGLWTGANLESTGAGQEVGPCGGMQGGSD